MAKNILVAGASQLQLKQLMAELTGDWQIQQIDNIEKIADYINTEDFEPEVIIYFDIGKVIASTFWVKLIQSLPPIEWVWVLTGKNPTGFKDIEPWLFDSVNWPVDDDKLKRLISKAARSTQIKRRLEYYSQVDFNRFNIDSYTGKSPAVVQLKKMLQELSGVPFTSLTITGETGTGKGLTAGIIHHTGQRKGAPFIELNCAALPKDLLESQLFGHEAGAFTGASTRLKGLFEQADGGTLFLDEIGDMDIELQAKLLKAIEEQKIRRLGSEKVISVDVQIIAATGIDLQQAVVEGNFRDDLFHRLSTFSIELPPLRDRKEDLYELAPKIIAEYNVKANKNVNFISDEIWQQLLGYDWPGNVRELRNVLERCVLFSKDKELPGEWLQLKERIAATINESSLVRASDYVSFPLDGSVGLADLEKFIIEEVLDKTGFNVSEAARLLKTTRQTLRYRIKKYAISRH
ncbi:sigma-54 interaction domain-containing protein [Aliikangiella maris]|uniref:Sigma-54 dependent transcriptional regulator n=2 Tax=Aliikangiella maris TaxID=3162458 RepID=A0ABV2BRK0_9GAMM